MEEDSEDMAGMYGIDLDRRSGLGAGETIPAVPDLECKHALWSFCLGSQYPEPPLAIEKRAKEFFLELLDFVRKELTLAHRLMPLGAVGADS